MGHFLRNKRLQCEGERADGEPDPGAPLPDLPPFRKPQWNAALVFERVEECVDVVGRLPGPFVPRLRSSRLPIVHDAEDVACHEPIVRRPPPPPDAIRRADEVLGWLNELPPGDARALWLRAARQSWRKVGAAIGLSHEGARHRVRTTLVALARRLDGMNVLPRVSPRRPLVMPLPAALTRRPIWSRSMCRGAMIVARS